VRYRKYLTAESSKLIVLGTALISPACLPAKKDDDGGGGAWTSGRRSNVHEKHHLQYFPNSGIKNKVTQTRDDICRGFPKLFQKTHVVLGLSGCCCAVSFDFL
jgi:hypothetical protein